MDLFLNQSKLGFLPFCYFINSFLGSEHLFGIRIQVSHKSNKITTHNNLELTKCPQIKRWTEPFNDPVLTSTCVVRSVEARRIDIPGGCQGIQLVGICCGSGKHSLGLLLRSGGPPKRGCTYSQLRKERQDYHWTNIPQESFTDSKIIGLARPCNAYCVPGTVLRTLYVPFNLF